MNKNEILEKNRKATPKDEGELFFKNQTYKFSMIAMMALLLLLYIYNGIKGLPTDAIMALVLANFTMQCFVNYRQSKNRLYMISGIVGILLCIGRAVMYVIKTW